MGDFGSLLRRDGLDRKRTYADSQFHSTGTPGACVAVRPRAERKGAEHAMPRLPWSAISVNTAFGPPHATTRVQNRGRAAACVRSASPHQGGQISPGCSGGSPITHCPGHARSRTVRMISLHSIQVSGRPSSRAFCSSRPWHSPQRQSNARNRTALQRRPDARSCRAVPAETKGAQATAAIASE